MPYSDLPIDELRTYRPNLAVPADLDAFWDETLRETRSHATPATFTPIDSGLDGHPVLRRHVRRVRRVTGAWLAAPSGRRDGAAARGRRVHRLWRRPGTRRISASAGRPPGSPISSWIRAARVRPGWSATRPDPDGSAAPAHPGFMTRGILDPRTYYYRRVIADAVRAVEAVREHPAVDASRIAVTGGSQGGGMSIAVGGLVDDLAAVMPDVPFLCDLPRALGLADSDPYAEIARYLRVHRDGVEAALETLSYFDGAILGRRATAPALFSVGLMDTVCPPSTVYAAYNCVRGRQGDPRVRVQRPRGRRRRPRGRPDGLAARAPDRSVAKTRLGIARERILSPDSQTTGSTIPSNGPGIWRSHVAKRPGRKE